jgi:formylglycine-generating enzyme required for sulfatase activity
MVAVLEIFCIDRHEASRPDATEESAGLDNSHATSRPDVLPWQVGADNALATAACAAAGKRLCTPVEWQAACKGPEDRVYGYGSTYSTTKCNGIDLFGRSGLKLLPTGSLETCVNGWGAADMNGNLWEHTAEGSGKTVRGGAYNCIDSAALHRCDYVPGNWTPSALGFRCCLTPTGRDPVDLDIVSRGDTPSSGDADTGGCLDPDVADTGDARPECLVDIDCKHLVSGSFGCQRATCEGNICVSQPVTDGSPCVDANPCRVGDSCLNGLCVSGNSTFACKDDNPCTDDECVADVGCVFTPNTDLCDDGNPCTENDQCVDGVCQPGENICLCEANEDCPDDGNLCNGSLFCDKQSVPYACHMVPGSAVVCQPPANPCEKSVCVPESGDCTQEALPDETLCDDGDPCNGPDRCFSGVCTPGTANLCACPNDMVSVKGQFCLDRYEASRQDATASSPGFDVSKATSRPGVIPWFPVDYAGARAACESSGKRLCLESEMLLSCRGTADRSYVYGNTYSATICNGIDVFCLCNSQNCAGVSPCPYPHCFSKSSSGEGGLGCGANFRVMPTGAFPDCVNEWGAFDINGNVWELVDTGTTESWYKGGAYNCGDSEYLHECSGMFQNISAKGFRCCQDLP